MRQSIRLMTVQMVAGLFADMQNPRYRGPNFSWERFAELAASHVGAQLPVMTVRLKQEEKAEATELAREYAQALVGRMQE